MPFIDVRVAKKLSDSEKENLKTALGKAAAIIHKPESYLMVAISDGEDDSALSRLNICKSLLSKLTHITSDFQTLYQRLD